MLAKGCRLGWIGSILVAGWVLLALAVGLNVTYAQDTDVLKDPVVLGAWLYEGHCVACHGPYAEARLAQLYEGEDDLQAAIAGGGRGCQVAWSIRYGGPLRVSEISALVHYMRTWEALGAAPTLPPLPPQPTFTPTPTPTSVARPADVDTPTPSHTPVPELDPKIRLMVEGSELARGAWLYMQNCYRCHLDYGYARMARSLSAKKVETTIRMGKAGTSMPAFGRRQGGELSSLEIQSIVRYIMAYEQLDAPPALPPGLLTAPTPDPAMLVKALLPETPLVAGDPRAGALRYVPRCAHCHGLYGEGGIGPLLAKAWSSVRPDLTVKAAIALCLSRAWNATTADGELTEQEVANLVSYILQLQP